MKNYKKKLSKKTSIKLIGDAKLSYEELCKQVKKQKKRGVESSKEISLANSIETAFDKLQANPFYGEHAKKKLIPKEYISHYDITNLFIIDLAQFWRLIYTLESDEVQVIAFVLDIFDHNTYNKKFNFKK